MSTRRERESWRACARSAAALVVLASLARGQFAEEQKFRPTQDVNPANSLFGETLDLFGDVAAVGGSQLNVQRGAVYIYRRDPSAQLGDRWTIEKYRKKPGAQAQGDNFGQAVALHGDTLLVGAPGESDTGPTDAGRAYVFVRQGTNWPQQGAVLKSDFEVESAIFGSSVDLWGDWAVIGARNDEKLGTSTRTGVAYVFHRDGAGSWTLDQRLEPSDPAGEDQFGRDVAIYESGGLVTVAVGAPFHQVSLQLLNTGAVYVYRRDLGGAWTEEPKLQLPTLEQAADDEYGCTVDLEGDTLIIGACGDNAADTNAGAVYVREFNGTIWSPVATLTSPTPQQNEALGFSVALHGTRAVIGTKGQAQGLDNKVFVAEKVGGTWALQQPALLSSHSVQSFGRAVALDGDMILVGSPHDESSMGSLSGAAFAFAPPDVLEETYCTAKTNSLGATPFIGTAGGFPSASVGGTNDYYVEGRNIVVYQTAGGTYSSTGVLYFTTVGRRNTNFHGGKLCVKAPNRFTPDLFQVYDPTFFKTSKGVLSVEFNSFIQGGSYPELMPGERVQAQWLFDDPWDSTLCSTNPPTPCLDGLTDGIEFVIAP